MDRMAGSPRVARLDVNGATDDFARALNRVAYKGERVTLQRRGKDVAALISVEDLTFLEEQEKRLECGRLRSGVQNHGKHIPRRKCRDNPVDNRRNGACTPRR